MIVLLESNQIKYVQASRISNTERNNLVTLFSAKTVNVLFLLFPFRPRPETEPLLPGYGHLRCPVCRLQATVHSSPAPSLDLQLPLIVTHDCVCSVLCIQTEACVCVQMF